MLLYRVMIAVHFKKKDQKQIAHQAMDFFAAKVQREHEGVKLSSIEENAKNYAVFVTPPHEVKGAEGGDRWKEKVTNRIKKQNLMANRP